MQCVRRTLKNCFADPPAPPSYRDATHLGTTEFEKKKIQNRLFHFRETETTCDSPTSSSPLLSLPTVCSASLSRSPVSPISVSPFVIPPTTDIAILSAHAKLLELSSSLAQEDHFSLT
ncbi:hypothetical protein ACLOJK_026219 [Asimina triloba]